MCPRAEEGNVQCLSQVCFSADDGEKSSSEGLPAGEGTGEEVSQEETWDWRGGPVLLTSEPPLQPAVLSSEKFVSLSKKCFLFRKKKSDTMLHGQIEY